MQDIKDAVVDQVATSTGANGGRPALSNAGAIQGNKDFASILQEFNIDARTIPSYLNLDLDLDVPTDDDYRPRQFQPIGTTIERFHNIPRGGPNTNDIVALATRFAPNEAAIRNAGYEDETAKEYVRGIAVVSIAMLLLYVVWGAILLLLRMGRLGEWKCFGRRCCARGVTCVENTRARGGCCARNVCGWMAGRVPKKPTEASLKRDARIKQSSLIKISRRGEGPRTEQVEAEAGAESEGSGSDGNDENKVEPADEIVISEEYLAKRRHREVRSMRAIRIGFLFSGAVVLAACVVLCVSGFRAIDNLIISAQESLLSIDEYFTGIIDECDKYIQSTEELSELRRDFLEGLVDNYTTSATSVGSSENTNYDTGATSGGKFCPNSGNGPIDININLGELFDGPFVKLAEVKSTATGKAENITVVSFLGQYELLGSVLDFDVAALRQRVEEFVRKGKETAQNVANTPASDLLNAGKEAAQDAVGNSDLLSSGKEAAQDAVGTSNIPAAVGEALPANLPNISNILAEAPIIGGDQRKRRHLQGDDIFSVGGGGANFAIIGNATQYKDMDLSALLSTNISLTIDFEAIVNQINERMDNQSPFFLLEAIETLRDGVANQRDGIRSMDDSAGNIRPYWYIAVIFASLLMVLVVLMMVATVLAWVEKQPRFLRCLNDGCILPTFIFFGMMVWIFTCVFLCLGILSGDLCINTPDEQINGMLEIILEPLSPIAYNFAHFYLNGCNPEDRPVLMDLIIVALIETREAATELFNMLSNLGPGALGRACGSDFNGIRAASYLLSVKLDSSVSVILSLARIILCKSFHPLYASLMYNIFCTDVIGFLGPMMLSLGLISVFSMVMVTLRVAWHELKDDIGNEDDDQMSSSGCCCRRIAESGKKKEKEVLADEDLILSEEGQEVAIEEGEEVLVDSEEKAPSIS